MNPDHFPQSILKISFNASSYIRIALLSGPFPPGFLIPHVLRFAPFFTSFTLVWSGSPSLLSSPHYVTPLGILVSNILNLFPLLNVRGSLLDTRSIITPLILGTFLGVNSEGEIV
jgi:hypothetical protein